MVLISKYHKAAYGLTNIFCDALRDSFLNIHFQLTKSKVMSHDAFRNSYSNAETEGTTHDVYAHPSM
jgi:hypothetical protein